MTKAELIKALDELCDIEEEEAHIRADRLLLDYIDDIEVTEAFFAIDKWYS